MTLERRLKRAKYFIARRDAELAKRGTTAGKEAAKKAAAPLPRLNAAQFQTNLSKQYDNDGNPYPTEPKGYTRDGGH